MARFILIDNHTGYIWGDSADLEGAVWSGDDALDFAKALDESIGDHGLTYIWAHTSDDENGYHAYRADIDGSDAVTVVHDGQDRDTIEAVKASCRSLGYIVRR